MAFVPVTDPDRLRELGLAGLLWFQCYDGTYIPAGYKTERWDTYGNATIVGAASRGRYHILLED